MRYCITISGLPPGILFHNGFSAIDKDSEVAKEVAAITGKRGRRTDKDDRRLRELECLRSFYADDKNLPTLPDTMLRSTIESAARKTKQGPKVREGLMVEPSSIEFTVEPPFAGRTIDDLAADPAVQHIARVVVQRNSLARCRPRLTNWRCAFVVDVDDTLVNQSDLLLWMQTAGKRIGLGDWRPEKSGTHGRFEVEGIDALK